MKNYHFKLFIIIFTSLLSGCSLVHLVESVALLPVAVVDGVIGTKMHSGITSGLSELERPGKRMDKQTIRTELSGKTFYPSPYIAYLYTNGDALLKRDNRIDKYKWSVEKEGEICIAGDICYPLRKKITLSCMDFLTNHSPSKMEM